MTKKLIFNQCDVDRRNIISDVLKFTELRTQSIWSIILDMILSSKSYEFETNVTNVQIYWRPSIKYFHF
jgi:hypothetical protein